MSDVSNVPPDLEGRLKRARWKPYDALVPVALMVAMGISIVIDTPELAAGFFSGAGINAAVGALFLAGYRAAIRDLRQGWQSEEGRGQPGAATALALATEWATRRRFGAPSQAGLMALTDASAIAIESGDRDALDMVSDRISELAQKPSNRRRINEALTERARVSFGSKASALANLARQVRSCGGP